MHGMVEAGADVIELGVPFSDPTADGPVIQKAGKKPWPWASGLAQVLDMVRDLPNATTSTPVVLMGYANPVERYDQRHGDGAFVRDAAAAGVDGVLVVDYPPEECEAVRRRLRAHGMDLIFLLAPPHRPERMQAGGRVASGYVYYVSLKGVTGSGARSTPSGGGHAAAHPRACEDPRSAWASASATRPRPRPSPRGRRRGHRQPHHPA